MAASTSASLAATTSTTGTVSTAAQDGGAAAERGKNISWQGSTNQHLANLIRNNYAAYLAPPQGHSKVGYAKAWAKELRILHSDPKGTKTKQNIDKLVSSWKTPNALSQRTGFGSIEINSKTVSAKEQILGICEVYDILAPALEDPALQIQLSDYPSLDCSKRRTPTLSSNQNPIKTIKMMGQMPRLQARCLLGESLR
jgi:hypothetical protein